MKKTNKLLMIFFAASMLIPLASQADDWRPRKVQSIAYELEEASTDTLRKARRSIGRHADQEGRSLVRALKRLKESTVRFQNRIQTNYRKPSGSRYEFRQVKENYRLAAREIRSYSPSRRVMSSWYDVSDQMRRLKNQYSKKSSSNKKWKRDLGLVIGGVIIGEILD